MKYFIKKLSMDKILLKKYLDNSCNVQELEKVLSWFRDTTFTEKEKALLYRIWLELPENESETGADYDSILNSIHHDINKHQTKHLLENAENDLIKYNRKRHVITFLRNAAAILLLPVLSLGLFFSFRYFSARSLFNSDDQAYNEIISSVDAITRVTLPDGSNVWLNHSSSLRYPAVFIGKCRKVELKGEGYFEVFSNPGIPFIVDVGEIRICARGTTFNVMAYPDEGKVETSLIKGSVEIQKVLHGEESISLRRMDPTDFTIYYKKNSEIITKTIYDDRYFSWKDGKLIFTVEPLEEVVKKLSRWFNVDIQLRDPELKDLTLTATFVHETLPQVMELLALVIPIRYNISERKKDQDGMFTKTKVILSHR